MKCKLFSNYKCEKIYEIDIVKKRGGLLTHELNFLQRIL